MIGAAPRMVFWEATKACNLSCAHCRRSTKDSSAPPGELSTRQARQMLDDIAANWRPTVVFSGGEPLLREDVYALAAYGASIGLRVALATNGTLVDKAAARRIASTGVSRVSVSLDAADARTHDAIRGVAGSFDQARRGIANLLNAGVSTQINCMLTRENASQLDAIYRQAKRLHVDALHLFVLVPVGCGATLSDDAQPSPGDCEKALRWMVRKGGNGRPQMRFTCAPQFYRVLKRMQDASAHASAGGPHAGGTRFATGCLAGRAICFVSSLGEVYPCGYLPVECGNVNREPLSRIWETSDRLRMLRDLRYLKGKCRICPSKRVCGGCRARAFAATGDMMGEDPLCAYSPPTRNTQSD